MKKKGRIYYYAVDETGKETEEFGSLSFTDIWVEGSFVHVLLEESESWIAFPSWRIIEIDYEEE